MRIKRGKTASRRHKKILGLAKGYKLGRKNLFRQAKEALLKAGSYAYRDRRTKKRVARSLWIIQLNAAVREHGLNYRDFINGLRMIDNQLNRKVLVQLSVESPEKFTHLCDQVKEKLGKKS